MDDDGDDDEVVSACQDDSEFEGEDESFWTWVVCGL